MPVESAVVERASFVRIILISLPDLVLLRLLAATAVRALVNAGQVILMGALGSLELVPLAILVLNSPISLIFEELADQLDASTSDGPCSCMTRLLYRYGQFTTLADSFIFGPLAFVGVAICVVHHAVYLS